MPRSLAADISFTLRSLRKSPTFTFIVVLALALGIGANTAIFSGINALLLGPMPYNHPEELVAIWEDASFVGFPHNTPAPANYSDWQRMNHVFTDLAALRSRVANVTGEGRPQVVLGHGVTANFFDVLGAHPMLGRTFDVNEDRIGAKVVVISYGLWQRSFHGARDVIGKTLTMNNEPCTVIGVMPPGFAFPDRQYEFWNPAHLTPQDLAKRQSHFLNVVGRLRPGVTVAKAQINMDTIAAQLQREYPGSNRKLGVVVVPLREQLVGDTRTAFLALLSAAGLVLLIACTNVANLLLTRSSERRREIAVRAALGANRGQIIRLLLTESLLLSAAGAAGGLLFALFGMHALQSLIPPDLVNASTLAMDTRVLCFTLAVSFASGVFFGLAPALKSSRLDLNDALKRGGRTFTEASRGLRRLFVIAEVSMAVMLLTGAGLLIETLSNLHAVDLGFPSHNLLTMSTPLSPQIYNTDPKILSFSDRIIASVSKLPGVRAVGFASNLPFTSIGNTNGFQIEGRAASSADQFNDALYREVSNNYLQTLGARLIAGRLLDGRDAANSPRAVVINQTFANRYWPGQSPLGARLSIGGTNRDSALRTVVGVIADIRERGFQLDMKPAMYLPFPQVQQPDARFLLVRTETDPLTLTDAVRKAIWSVDPEQPVAVVRTMDQYIDEEIQGRAHEMKVFATFATLAVFLAALGIYGVLAYSVAQRRREIGVRLVLGATRVAVTGLVLRQGLLLTVIGLGVGSMFAAAATQAMRSMLYGVKPLDPAIYLEGAAILLLAGLTASMLPTISASRVDPASILRDE